MNKWMMSVRSAWDVYRRKLSRAKADDGLDADEFLKQKVDDSMTLEEFSEIVFTQGFAAGEMHGKTSIFRDGESRYRIN